MATLPVLLQKILQVIQSKVATQLYYSYYCEKLIIISAKKVMFSPVSVCLSVNMITQKPMIKSLWNFMESLDIIQAPID